MVRPQKSMLSKEQKISSIRNHPLDKHIEKVSIIRNAIEKSVKDGYTHKHGRKPYGNVSHEMVEWFDDTINWLKKIRFDILDDEEIVLIFDILYGWIPLTAERFLSRYLVDFNEYAASNMVYDLKYNAKIYFKCVVDDQRGTIIRNEYRKEVVSFGHPGSTLKGYVKNINPEVFPKITATDYRVTSAIDKVKKLWTAASAHENTVEDEFFLEQVVTAYLPESHNLYLNFEKADAGMKKKAVEGFLEQMSLIEDRLKIIVNVKQESNMKALKTHTLFLRSSLKQPEKESQLVLTKGR